MNDTMRGAMTMFFHLGVYDQLLHRELGTERATALQKEVMMKLAKTQADMVKEQTGIQDFDLETIHSIFPPLMKDIVGMEFELTEKTPTKLTYDVGHCVVYESSLMLGTEHDAIQARCTATSSLWVDSFLKELNPNVSLEVHRFRQSAAEPCVESIVLST